MSTISRLCGCWNRKKSIFKYKTSNALNTCTVKIVYNGWRYSYRLIQCYKNVFMMTETIIHHSMDIWTWTFDSSKNPEEKKYHSFHKYMEVTRHFQHWYQSEMILEKCFKIQPCITGINYILIYIQIENNITVFAILTE